MNARNTLIAALIIGIIGIVGTGNPGFASGQKGIDTVKQNKLETQIKARSIEVRGVVKKTEAGLVLFDGKKTYLLKGDDVLDSLAGKLVDISGDLQAGEKGPAILVKKAMVAD